MFVVFQDRSTGDYPVQIESVGDQKRAATGYLTLGTKCVTVEQRFSFRNGNEYWVEKDRCRAGGRACVNQGHQHEGVDAAKGGDHHEQIS